MALLRLPTLLALAAAVAALAVGCGGSATSTPPQQLDDLSLVAQRTASADTARFDLSFEMTFPGAPQRLAFGADGAFDTALERAQMTIDLSSLVDLLGALGGPLGGDAGAQLGSPDDWKLDVVIDGKVAYVKVPAFAADKVPGGKSWIKGDLETLAQAGGSGLDLGSFGASDPRQVLEALESVAGDLELVGRDSQRGVDTTHYRATLDLRALLESGAGKDATAMLGSLDQLLEQSGLSAIPLDVWVDDDQLLRRLDLSFSMTPPGEQGMLEASMRFELYDFGKPLFVELPSPDDVADASALQQGS